MRRVLAFLGILVLFGCAQTAEESARAVFGIAEGQVVDTATVRRAALARFPIGTPESSVVDRLKESGFTEGSSGAAHYIVTRSEVILGLDDPQQGLVTESYGIRFLLDNQRRVTDVEVERWLTGL